MTRAMLVNNASSSRNDAPLSRRPLREPLEKLARFAFDWSEDLCDPAHGCASYHKMWSLVRHLEANGDLPSGEDFFDREVPKVARGGRAKVLLSGAADTGLMTLAANALMKASLTPEIIMVDRCATPLEQAKLFAKSNGISLTTYQGTLDQIEALDVDAVLAHSFITFIPKADRPTLFKAWHRALRPGGRVILSQRLTPDGETYVRQRPPAQIAERRVRLAETVRNGMPVNADVETLLDAAEALWTSPLGGNSVSPAEIQTLCKGCGLQVKSISYDHSDKSVSPFAMAKQAVKRARAEIVLAR